MTQLNLFEEQDMQRVKRTTFQKNKGDYSDYEGFTEKFKDKHTTDDCFTSPAVYDAVLQFVGEELADVKSRPVVRPFYPGGNYKEFPYPENCIVIDNPPFSIYAQIVTWYAVRGIDYFLFAPHLTLCSSTVAARTNACFLICGASVTYENGAVVNTSFVTSLCYDLKLWVCPKLKHMVEEADKQGRREIVELPVYKHPDNVFTAALAGRFSIVDFRVRADECRWINGLESMKRAGKSLFGGGFLLSDRKAAEKREAEKRAAEMREANRRQTKPTIEWQLSEREKEIILQLGENRRKK